VSTPVAHGEGRSGVGEEAHMQGGVDDIFLAIDAEWESKPWLPERRAVQGCWLGAGEGDTRDEEEKRVRIKFTQFVLKVRVFLV